MSKSSNLLISLQKRKAEKRKSITFRKLLLMVDAIRKCSVQISSVRDSILVTNLQAVLNTEAPSLQIILETPAVLTEPDDIFGAESTRDCLIPFVRTHINEYIQDHPNSDEIEPLKIILTVFEEFKNYPHDSKESSGQG